MKWPLLKWAGGCNDKYFAKLGTSKNQQAMISVYEAPDMARTPCPSTSLLLLLGVPSSLGAAGQEVFEIGSRSGIRMESLRSHHVHLSKRERQSACQN